MITTHHDTYEVVIFDRSVASFLYRIHHELLSAWVCLCVLYSTRTGHYAGDLRETEQRPNLGSRSAPESGRLVPGVFFGWPFHQRAWHPP